MVNAHQKQVQISTPLMLIDSILEKDGKCYLEMFLKDYKYIITIKRMMRYINQEIELSSDENVYDNESY